MAVGLAKEKIQVQVFGARVQSFEDAFGKIEMATGIEDLDQLGTFFAQKENENSRSPTMSMVRATKLKSSRNGLPH